MATALSPQRIDQQAPHPSGAVGIGVIALAMWALIGLVVASAWFIAADSPPRAPGPTAAVAEAERAETAGQPARMVTSAAADRPERVRIDRIGVDAPLMDLGLTRSRELEVPPLSRPRVAGWYDRSPVPGDVGPSVLAGHVDSRTGPAVFFRVHELRRGDLIAVDRSDGRTATFVVDRVEQVSKSRFPTRRVYGATPGPELRLITCGGTFDAEAGHYLSNVVVYARLSSLTPA